MRPIILKGHTRPLTEVCVNRDGDLFFTTAKDKVVNVWYSSNGERLGTYNGHEGAVFHCAVDFHSKYLLTASGDMTCRLWEVETGQMLKTFPMKSVSRCVDFALGDQQFLSIGDKSMGQEASIYIYDLKRGLTEENAEPTKILQCNQDKRINRALWSDMNKAIITVSDDGVVRKMDVETGEEIARAQHSKKGVVNIRYSPDRSMFITSDQDHCARLYDTKTLELKKEYRSDRPINAAAIHPTKDIVAIGGGQDAMSVTVTAHSSGKFESFFYHMVYEDLIGSIKGHFGPINTMGFTPDGLQFISGAEDGYVRLHTFDDDFNKMDLS